MKTTYLLFCGYTACADVYHRLPNRNVVCRWMWPSISFKQNEYRED